MRKPGILVILVLAGLATPFDRAQAAKKKSPFQGKLVATTWIKDLSTKKAYRIKEYPDGEWSVIGEMSPPGDLIVFDSMVRINGGKEISVLKVIGSNGSSEKVILRSNGGFKSSWSPDGKFILVNIDGFRDRIVIEKDTLAAWRLGIPEQASVGWLNWWSKDGKTIFFLGRRKDSPEYEAIYRMQLDGANLEELMKLDVPRGIGSFDLSPDEKKFITAYGDLFARTLK